MNKRTSDIAVIGIGLDIANTNNVEDFWQLFENNIDCIRKMPEHRKEQVNKYARMYLRDNEKIQYFTGCFLEHVDEFDKEFFRISPREAQVMDPVHRILLQTILHTFDDAGYSPDKLAGTNTGIFVGYTSGAVKDNYFTNIIFSHPELLKYSMVGNMAPIIPSRASHLLDLRGPTMVIDTACSASLVAVHEACEKIRNQSCTMAVAGGIKLNLLPVVVQDMMIGIESADGKTRAFDDYANGAGIGEGSACVLLKPLEDAQRDGDHIYAVVKGSAINHDGRSSSITAPNPASQARVILSAWENSGVDPSQIEYIETHGTGTLLGDPVEYQGLSHAFEKVTSKKQFCALSSAKSNIGHLFECAGIASFIKAIAALKNKQIPGMKNFNLPNKNIDFPDSPFYVNTTTKKWEKTSKGLRTCGVSAFGLSGTNCHIVLQEYIADTMQNMDCPANIFCVSAKSDYSLNAYLCAYQEFICQSDLNVHRIAACANIYRPHFPKRIAIIFENRKDLLQKLQTICASAPESWNKINNVIYLPNANASTPQNTSIGETISICSDLMQSNEYDKKQSLIDNLLYLANQYINSSVVDWITMYSWTTIGRIPLPHYPFQKDRSWLPDSEHKCPVTTFQTTQTDGDSEKSYFDIDGYYYERYFTESPLPPSGHKMGTCLLICHAGFVPNQLLASLQGGFIQVRILVLDFEQCVSEGTSKYLSESFDTIDFTEPSHIVIATALFHKSPETAPKLSFFIESQMQCLVLLYRRLKTRTNPISVIHICDNAFEVTGNETCLKPEQACLFGMGKSFNRQYNHIHMYTLDTDEKTGMDMIQQEICSCPDTGIISDIKTSNFYLSHNDIILYRDGKRYVEGIREKNMTIRNPVPLHDSGVYLVTGGLGGIGFETSLEIAKRKENVTLILVGRTKLAHSADWDSVLKREPQGEQARLITRLRVLQHYSKEAQYVSCDITDPSAIFTLMEYIDSSYGRLNGVVHAAGLGGGTTLENMDEVRIKSITAPKIQGTYLLDMATRCYLPDFFLMYSSNSTIFSSSDLPDYIAGNMYLDAYSKFRARQCSGLSLTINWATWSETGMSVKHEFTFDTITKSILTNNAISALFTAMQGLSGSFMIAQLNLHNKIGLLIRRYPLVLSPCIQNALDRLQNTEVVSNSPKSVSPHRGYIQMEEAIEGICRKVLGYEEVDVTKNFFELGADSIMLALIFREINEMYPDKLKVTDLFSFPTVKSLAEYAASLCGSPEVEERNLVSSDVSKANDVICDFYNESFDGANNHTLEGVAIIGVGLAMPSADDLDSYWETVSNGINVVRPIPNARSSDITKHLRNQGINPETIQYRKMGYLDHINQFDYAFFGMSPREASIIDPVNRLFLQCCAKAIDDSGYGRQGVQGTNTSIFLGYSASNCNTYSRLLFEADQTLFNDSMAVNQISMAASRIAYVYNLKGPSMVIDTACSSSLVAIHMACEQIMQEKCEMALVGGASLAYTPIANGCDVGFESPEEITRAFSKDSSGSAIGEGVGTILLKPLRKAMSDHDNIYAVIKGSAINQDGSSFGIAAPNYYAQSEAIQQAWSIAGVTAEDITYIETHGTGTQLGDTIEIKGIKHAFETATQRKQICGVGSVKTNFGHANEASGMSGIFKLIGMLQHKRMPSSLYFKTPNPNIDFVDSPLYAVTRDMPLQPVGNRYIVGISGFGMSGTNAHLVLENAPHIKKISPPLTKFPFIFTASAITLTSLRRLLMDYRTYLSTLSEQDLYDFCCNLNLSRGNYQYRFAFIAYSLDEMIVQLCHALQNKDNSLECPGCHVGHFSITSENKLNRYPYEITILEQQELTRQCNAIIKNHQDKSWDTLLTFYVKGACINWHSIYSKSYNKLHLPVYAFDTKYCWYSTPEIDKLSDVKLDSYFHAKKWVQLDHNGPSNVQPGTNVLVVYDKTNYEVEFTHAFVELGCDVTDVVIETSGKFTINEDTVHMQSDENNYHMLFSMLEQKNISYIIHRRSIRHKPAPEITQINDGIELGFFDLISMFKGMAKAHVSQEITICIISNQAYSISREEKFNLPHNATTMSLGKVVEQENPNITCRAIDIDLCTAHKIVAKEVFSKHDLYLVGFRQNARYVEEFSDIQIEPAMHNRFRYNGVYLITGGTDGLGLETAKYISEQVQCTIILMSRSGFIDESLWTEYINNQDYCMRISILKEIQTNQCHLEITSCDVSDWESVKNAVHNINCKHGRIDGIIHAAGISGAGYILRKEKPSYLSVMAPKIAGTWNLDMATKQTPPDFMILFSSGVTDGGEAGQSDYLAANAFLDAYTDYRNMQNRNTYTINWCSWKETGMSYRYGVNVDSITKVMNTKEAIAALDLFIRGAEYKRAMIGQYNINPNFFTLMQHVRNHLSPEFAEKINNHSTNVGIENNLENLNDGTRDFAQIRKGRIVFIPKSEKVQNRLQSVKDAKLEGDPTNQYSSTEMEIAKVYSSLLGYEVINVYDNFFEMGGDSILLATMYDMLDNIFPNVIRIAFLFEYCSIRSLAEFIDDKKKKNNQEQIPIDSCSAVRRVANLMQASISELEPSSTQMRIYYEYRLRENKLTYNNPFFINVSDMDDAKIETCLRKLVERYDMLRTSFTIKNGKLMQTIKRAIPIKVDYVDVLEPIEPDFKTHLHVFQLRKSPLFYFTVFRCTNKKILMFDIHHILVDGFSSSLLQKDFADLSADLPLEENIVHYKDYVEFEKGFYHTNEYADIRSYWKTRFAGCNFSNPLAKIAHETSMTGYQTIIQTIPPKIADRLVDSAKKLRITLFHMLISSLAFCISTKGNVTDVVFLAATLNRYKPKFNHVVGVFTNLIPLRYKVDFSQDLGNFIVDTAKTYIEDMKHQYYQYHHFMQDHQTLSPKFYLYFNFEDNSLKKVFGTDIMYNSNISLFDLDINIKKKNEVYQVIATYKSESYDKRDIESLLQIFVDMLAQLTEQ